MRNREVQQRLGQLYNLIDRAGDATRDINLQGHWGRYLCVMAAAFLERSLQAIYSDFASGSSSPNAARFVSNRLGRVTNPNSETFLEIAGAFNPVWRAELESLFDDDPHLTKGAINSIMSARNNIAHGGTTEITVARVREYLDRSVAVLEFIENQCIGAA